MSALQSLIQLGFFLHLGNYWTTGKLNVFSHRHSDLQRLTLRDKAYFQMEPGNQAMRSWALSTIRGTLHTLGCRADFLQVGVDQGLGSLGQTLTPPPSSLGNQRGHPYTLTKVENNNLSCVCRGRNLSHFLEVSLDSVHTAFYISRPEMAHQVLLML